jgi:Tol biopolymer transport system component
VYRIDSTTGTSTLLAATPNIGLSAAQLSRDGRRLYFWGGGVPRGSEGSIFFERDLASESDRELFRGPGPAFPEVSPDGRFLAGTWYDPRSKSSVVLLMPVSGGTPKELLRVNAPQQFDGWGYVSWTPDARHVVVPFHEGERSEANSVHDLLLVPIDGSAPRKLGLDTRFLARGGVRLHPDGRQVAYATGGNRRQEVWALENFLPISQTGR